MTYLSLLGLLAPISIGALLFVLARLSHRLGAVTRARPYYRILYAAAFLVWLAALARLLLILDGAGLAANAYRNLAYTLLVDGIPALSLTLGAAVAWYYWSWLLAERD